MIKYSRTFDAVTTELRRILKEELHRKDGTLDAYKMQWNRVERFMKSNNLQYLTPDICDNYLISAFDTKELLSLDSQDKKLMSAIIFLKDFLITGTIIPRKEIINLEGEIGELMIKYVSSRKAERLSDHTIYQQEQFLSRFLKFLNAQKITFIKAVNEGHIIQFLNSITRKYKSSGGVAIHILRPFFRYLYQNKHIDIDLASFIPRNNYKKQAKLPSTYKSQEIKDILSAVDRSTAIGKRNYSILLLASMLGLRASDIANLKFENILWENNLLRIHQHKTGDGLELPLLPDVGNAIIEYLHYGRPKSDLKFVFLLAHSPFTRISQSVVTQIVKKGFAQAKIDTSDKHHGAHALRHSLATLLLQENVNLPVISEVLGHKDSQSTMYYLRIDLQSLKKCALEVPLIGENFYNQKGGCFYE